MKKQPECLAYLEALEGNQVGSATFTAHLATCPSCREALETMRSMKALKTVYAATGAEALKARISQEIARPAVGMSPKGSSGLPISGVVAALAVVGMVVAGSLLLSSGSSPSGIAGEPGSRPAISSSTISPDRPAGTLPEAASNSFVSTASVPLPSPDQE